MLQTLPYSSQYPKAVGPDAVTPPLTDVETRQIQLNQLAKVNIQDVAEPGLNSVPLLHLLRGPPSPGSVYPTASLWIPQCLFKLESKTKHAKVDTQSFFSMLCLCEQDHHPAKCISQEPKSFGAQSFSESLASANGDTQRWGECLHQLRGWVSPCAESTTHSRSCH